MSAVNLTKSLVQFTIGSAVSLFVLPQEYGLIAYATPIVNFITLFTDLGLSSAVVREPKLDRADAGAAFTLSLTCALVATTLLVLVAFPLEHASHLKGLAPLLIALTLALLFSISTAIPRAMLERQMRYRRIASIEIAALTIAGTVSVSALFAGLGIWAVVVNQVLLHAIRMTSFIFESRHQIVLNTGWRKIVRLASVGGWVLSGNILGFASRNVDNLLVGTFLGAKAVGLYGMAYQFMTLPLLAISWPASGVLLSALSRAREDNKYRLSAMLVGITQLTAAASFPLMGFMTFGLAFPVASLLSPRWGGVVAIIRILAFAGAIQSVAAYTGVVLISNGRLKLNFVINLFNGILILSGFAISLHWGLLIFCSVYVATTCITCAVGVVTVIVYSGIDFRQYFRSLLPPVLATMLGWGAAQLVAIYWHGWSGWAGAAMAFTCGVLVIYILFRKQLLCSLNGLVG